MVFIWIYLFIAGGPRKYRRLRLGGVFFSRGFACITKYYRVRVANGLSCIIELLFLGFESFLSG